MIANYTIRVRKKTIQPSYLKMETFNNSEDYSIRLAELIIRFSQKEKGSYKITTYKDHHLIKCITIENLKEK